MRSWRRPRSRRSPGETSRPGTPAGGRSSLPAGAGVSERFACRVTGQHRAPNAMNRCRRRRRSRSRVASLAASLRQEPSPVRVSPAYHDARGEGWQVNHKKIQRLWREEGLRVSQRRRRKRHGTSTASDTVVAGAPNRVWAVDFQFDGTTDIRPIKIVSIVDEHTRECLAAWSSAASPAST